MSVSSDSDTSSAGSIHGSESPKYVSKDDHTLIHSRIKRKLIQVAKQPLSN